MAVENLTNQVSIDGQYGNPASAITFASNVVTTKIVQGLTVTKTADKTNWVDGPLTYTVLVENNSGETLTSGSLTDVLDTNLVEFNSTYGVQINSQSSSNFTYESGTLKITLPDLADTEQATITFQVTRKS